MTSKRGLWFCFILQGVCLLGFALCGSLFESYAKKIAVPIWVNKDDRWDWYSEWSFDQSDDAAFQGEEAMALKEDLASLRFSAGGYGASYVNRPGVIYVRTWHGRTVVDKIMVDGQPVDEARIWWARRY
jgi:hypothetical protein